MEIMEIPENIWPARPRRQLHLQIAEEPRETYPEAEVCEVSQMDLLGGRQYSIGGMRMKR
jgi:hypothetical protein